MHAYMGVCVFVTLRSVYLKPITTCLSQPQMGVAIFVQISPTLENNSLFTAVHLICDTAKIRGAGHVI